jgi:hypothetical protein
MIGEWLEAYNPTEILTYVYVDFIVLALAYLSIVFVGYPNKTKVFFAAFYVGLLSAFAYLGVYSIGPVVGANVYYPSVVIGAYFALVIIVLVCTLVLCVNRKPYETLIVLVPMVALPFLFHYSHYSGFLYIEEPYLRGFWGTVSPLVCASFYIFAKLKSDSRAQLGFFLVFTIYLSVIERGTNIANFSRLWFLLFLVVLALALAKRSHLVFGTKRK